MLSEVVELRPINVLGDVKAPGVYPFRYGSTVKSAVALAGGFGMSEPVAGVALSEFLLADERVRALEATMWGLLVREARLRAQLDGAKTFTAPSMRPTIDAGDAAKLIAEDTDVLARESEDFEKQVDLVRSQKPQLLSEDKAIAAEIGSEKQQVALVQSQIDEYSKLTEKGLGRSSSMLDLKLALANKQSNIWRLEAERSRLRVSIMEFDARIQELETSRRRQILSELQDVRQRLHDAEVALPSAKQVRAARLQQTGNLVSSEANRDITITRLRDTLVSTFAASETSLLEPGDIVQVRSQQSLTSRSPIAAKGTKGLAKPIEPAGVAQQ